MTDTDMIADLREKAEKVEQGPIEIYHDDYCVSNGYGHLATFEFADDAALYVAMRNNLERLLALASSAASAREAGERAMRERAAKVARDVQWAHAAAGISNTLARARALNAEAIATAIEALTIGGEDE